MNRNQAMNAALIDSEIEIGNMGCEAAFMRACLGMIESSDQSGEAWDGINARAGGSDAIYRRFERIAQCVTQGIDGAILPRSEGEDGAMLVRRIGRTSEGVRGPVISDPTQSAWLGLMQDFYYAWDWYQPRAEREIDGARRTIEAVAQLASDFASRGRHSSRGGWVLSVAPGWVPDVLIDNERKSA